MTGRNILALPGAILITVAGYYLAEGLLFGFRAAALVSIGSNLIQGVGSAAAFLIFGLALDRLSFKTRFFLREREQKRQKYGKMKWNIADGKRIFERAEGFDFVFFSVQSRNRMTPTMGKREKNTEQKAIKKAENGRISTEDVHGKVNQE